MTQVGFMAKPETLPSVEVSAKDLMRLKACRKSYDFHKLGLHYEGHEQRKCLYRALTDIRTHVCDHTLDQAKVSVRQILKDGLKNEHFSCKAEASAAREMDVKLLDRFMEYLYSYEVVKSNMSYRLALPDVKYRGMNLVAVSGIVDYILRDKQGVIHSVKVCVGKPREAMRAKIFANKPENSLELIHTYLGTKTLIQEPFIAELWYLSNKDDTGSCVIERFEHRPGKNIITYDFSKMSDAQIFGTWRQVLSGAEERPCEDCRHCSLCQIGEHLRLETKVRPCDNGTADSVEKRFTPQQKKVIEHVEGPLAAIAVPGAGKTTSLVERVVHLVKECDVQPSSILMVTFTKKATKEIEERVDARLRECGVKGRPSIMDFHALALTILMENPMSFGGKVSVATDTDRCSLVFDVMKETSIEGIGYYDTYGEYGPVRVMDRLFKELSETGNDIELFKKRHAKYDAKAVQTAFEKFKKIYHEKRFVSFDELIHQACTLLENYPMLAKYYSKKWNFIMVDEFQDSEEEQVEMVYQIARYHRNIVVVGDDDQSVYGWRGGSSRFLLEYKKDWCDAEVVFMQDNFRSNSGVTSLCNQIVSGVETRYDKEITAHKKETVKPTYLRNVDMTYLLRILNSAKMHGRRMGEIAILARNNKRLDDVSALLDGKYPFLLPKDYLVADEVFLAIYSMMRLAFDGMDSDEALYRVIAVLGGKNLVMKSDREKTLYSELVSHYMLPEISEMDSLSKLEQSTDQMAHIFSKIARCRRMLQTSSVREALQSVLVELYGTNGHLVLDALYELADQKSIVDNRELYGVMTDMVHFGSLERVGYPTDPDSITLLTCHDAKGMEFPLVIIYGMEDFSCDQDEEIHVLYVAASRAKDTLILMDTGCGKYYEGFENILPYVNVAGQSSY